MSKPVIIKRIIFFVMVLLLVSEGYSQRADALIKSGNLKYSKQDYTGAITDYTKAIKLDPSSAESYCLRANAKRYLQDFEGAISDYDKAIEIDPNDEESFSGRGYARIILRDFNGAIKDYNIAILINPYSSAYFFRGLAKSLLGEYSDAITDYTYQIEINPDNDFSYLYRGKARIELQDYKSALSDFSKAIVLNPNNSDSYLSRGKANQELKDFNGALSDYTKAIEISPDNPLPYSFRGDLKYSLKDFNGTIADLTKVIELDAGIPGTYYKRGRSKSDLQDYNGAIEDFTLALADTLAIDIFPEFAETYYYRGLANIQSGRKENGCMDFNKAAESGFSEAYEKIYEFCKVTPEQLDYLLIKAVMDNNMPRLKELVQKGANVSFKFNYRIMANEWGAFYEYFCSPIHIACDSGYYEIAQFLLEKGADVNAVNSQGMTPVISGNRHPDILRLLLDKGADARTLLLGNIPLTPDILLLLVGKGADVNAKNDDGITPLHLADTIEIARLLIEKGADINAKDKDGKTPLIYASIFNYPEVARLLIEKGADVNAVDNSGLTPLINSLYNDNTEITSLLIKKKADVNAKDKWGDTPLHLARSADIAQLMIEKGADLNVKNNEGSTPLSSAIANRYSDIARLLIEKGAKIRDESGFTPLCMAISNNLKDIVIMLIEKGADVRENEGEYQKTPLEYAKTSEMAKLLIEKGADINAKHLNGQSPLFMVDSVEVARLLIEKGAVINAKDNDGQTPLFAAIKKDNFDLYMFFIEKGADVNLKDDFGNTPIHFAQSPDAALGLTAYGADVNVKDYSGDTPLHKVTRANVAKFLIEKGAVIDAMNQNGETPLLKALNYHIDVARLLIEEGADVNSRDNNGSTPLFNRGYLNAGLVEFLIKNGADVKIKNNYGLTPLHVHYLTEIDSILILNGADVNARDNAGRTPLHYVSDPGIVRFLISKGADVNVVDNFGYTTFTSMLIPVPEIESASLVLNAGHQIDFKNEKGQTALIIVTNESAEKESLEYLLRNNADEGLKDRNGKTALDYARALGKVKFINLLSTPVCIRVLQNKGQKAVIDLLKNDTTGISQRDSFGKTLLHYMVSGRCDTLFDFILTHYKNKRLLNVCNSEHQTPLFAALTQFKTDYALRLIEAGADINIPDSNGESPLFIAEHHNLEAVSRSLRKKNAIAKTPVYPIELSLPMGHVAEKINCMSISPDGRTFISGDNDNIIKLWDIASGKEIRTFRGHEDEILCLSFSPDGRTFISGSEDRTIRLWDINSGNELGTFNGNDYGVSILRFLADGKSFVSNDQANNIKIWELATGQEMKDGISGELSMGRGNNFFLPDGKSFMRQEYDALKLYDITTGKVSGSFMWKDNSDLTAVSFSSDGLSFMISADSIIKLWDINTGNLKGSFTGKNKRIGGLSFSPDGKSFISFGDKTIECWNIATGKVFQTIELYNNWQTSLSFLPDGKSFITCSNYDRTFNLWDIETGTMLRTFEGSSRYILNFDLSKSGNKILIGSFPDIKLVNFSNSIKLKSYYGHNYGVFNVNFSPDSRSFLSSGCDSTIRMWNIESGKNLRTFTDNQFRFSGSRFSPDGKTIVTAGWSWDNSCKRWDIASGKELNSYFKNGERVFSFRFSPDNKSLLSGGKDTIRLLDLKSGKVLRNFGGHSDVVNSLDFSPDGKSFISGSKDETVILWDIASGKEMKSILGHEGEITSVSFSPDGKTILSGSTDKTLKLWDAASGLPIRAFTGHTGTVVNARFHPSGKFIISSSDDKTIKYWNIDSTKETATLVLIDSLDWVLYTPDKYYAATKNGAKALGWVRGTQVWNFDQWDLQYNRPDIVFSRMPDADTAMINLYHKAYQKRLKKLNFNESMFRSDFNTPQIKIEKQASIGKQTVELEISAVDTLYPIDRINVWVNEVPVYGINGISLRGVKQSKGAAVTKQLVLALSEGDNKIEVSVLNSAGAESVKQTAWAKNESPVAKKDLWFIAVSCADYKNTDYNLKYSVKDGRDMARQFAASKSTFGNIFIDTLFNAAATRENVAALKQKLLKSKADDQVILFTSGHGLLSDSLDFYFATYDMDFQHPEARGISFDDLESILDSIPARKKLLMMDACHSGELDKEEMGEMPAVNTAGAPDIAFRGNVREYNAKAADTPPAKPGVTLNNSFELMQELFTGLDKGTGTTVISAAAGKGYALESPQWNNGVFTYSILNGMKNKAADKNGDGIITISELKDYSIKQVELLTGGRQKPTARRESIGYDWKIW